jgi:hypothetical protein
MAIGSFSPPKGWEDWATLILGILMWAVPIILQLGEPAVLQNFLIVGFLVIFCELFAFYFLRTWEERINIILAAWLMISTWLLASAPPARATAVILGVLLIALSLYEIWEDRHQHAAGD